MNAKTAVAAFTVGVGTLFVTAYGVGTAVGPIAQAPVTHDATHPDGQPMNTTSDAHDQHGGEQHAETAADTDSAQIPGGLMVSQNGYTLDLTRDTTAPGEERLVEFTVTGPDGEPVTEFDVEHDKQLHLIAVRRDFAGFQHVHPVMDDTGTWAIPLALQAGQWRLFADFTPTGGQAVTLGADLLVPGRVDVRPAEAETRTARVGGYEVTLTGDLHPGTDAKLTLSITRDGIPVTDLEPYLGAYGHVVALREGDLAYLHVHPDGTPGDGRTEPGPDVVFYAAVPSEGDYHLYLDFKHAGVVRTVKFHLGTGVASEPQAESQSGDHPAGSPSDDSADDEAAHSH